MIYAGENSPEEALLTKSLATGEPANIQVRFDRESGSTSTRISPSVARRIPVLTPRVPTTGKKKSYKVTESKKKSIVHALRKVSNNMT